MLYNDAQETVHAYRSCPLVPGRDRVAERAINDAINVVGAVRELDPREVWGSLALWNRDEPNRLYAAITALAAMVPQDRSASDLLAWTKTLRGAA